MSCPSNEPITVTLPTSVPGSLRLLGEGHPRSAGSPRPTPTPRSAMLAPSGRLLLEGNSPVPRHRTWAPAGHAVHRGTARTAVPHLLQAPRRVVDVADARLTPAPWSDDRAQLAPGKTSRLPGTSCSCGLSGSTHDPLACRWRVHLRRRTTSMRSRTWTPSGTLMKLSLRRAATSSADHGEITAGVGDTTMPLHLVARGNGGSRSCWSLRRRSASS